MEGAGPLSSYEYDPQNSQIVCFFFKSESSQSRCRMTTDTRMKTVGEDLQKDATNVIVVREETGVEENIETVTVVIVRTATENETEIDMEILRLLHFQVMASKAHTW